MIAQKVLGGASEVFINQLRAVITAWMHFTQAERPRRLHAFAQKGMLHPGQAARYLPLISAMTGLFSGLVFLGLDYLTGSKALGVTGAIIFTVWLTHAFRERGAGHFFDQVSRGQTNEYARAIGATGTIAIFLLIFAKFQLLLAMPHHLILTALIAAHAFSSFVTMAFLFTHRPLKPELHGWYTRLSGVRLDDVDFIILALLGMLPIALFAHPVYIVLLPVIWIIRAILGAYLTRRPERYTSDALAITQQSSELAFYMGVLVLTQFVAGL